MESSSNSTAETNISSTATAPAVTLSVSVVPAGVAMDDTTQASLGSNTMKETMALVSELCRHFYTLGWVMGTGGNITIKVPDEAVPKARQLIIMSPSGSLSLPYLYTYMCMHTCLFGYIHVGESK